jgi:hypothetical protein
VNRAALKMGMMCRVIYQCNRMLKYNINKFVNSRRLLKFYIYIYIYSIPTSQETQYVSAIKPNRLMLFTEIIAV